MKVLFLGQEDPLEVELATHSSIPAWEIPSSVHGVPKSRHDWTHTPLRPQAQEDSSHSPVIDSCLASGPELLELPCTGATPEITAELLILYGS